MIELTDVAYRYPTATTRTNGEAGRAWALSGVTLRIEEGEFVAVMGRNGAGKTTLCLTLAGLIPHFFKGTLQGEVRVGNLTTREAHLTDLITRVGIVFQNPFDQLTTATDSVYAEVAFGPEHLGLPRDEIIARVDQALRWTRIADLRDRDPFHLSGGQQQRVAIAGVLAMRPSVLVLDEPTSQLDPVGTDEVLETLQEMRRHGATVIMAEHKVESIAQIADRVIVLQDGRVVLEGTPRQVLEDPALASCGVQPPYFTTLGRELAALGLWKGPLPLTLEEAVTGLEAILK